MNRILISLFILLAVTTLSARDFSGYYVSLQGDTIQCTFKVGVNLFKKDLLNQLTFQKRVKIKTKDGVKKFRPYELRMFQIDGTSRGSEKYVS